MAEVLQDAVDNSKLFIDSEKDNEVKSIVENGTLKSTNEPDENSKDEEKKEEETKDEETKDEEEEEPEWMDILGSGHIKKKVLIKGKAESRPQSKDICELSFEGQLSDGTVVEKEDRIEIHVGDAEVIQGMDLAIALMNEGEKCILELNPRFAYGVLGRPPVLDYPAIGINDSLTYTIELFSVKPEPEMSDIPIAERKKIGNRKRERGNWWYNRNEHTLAIHCYRRALEYLDEAVGGINYDPKISSEDEEAALKDLLEDRLKVYNNLAAAQLKIGAFDAGLSALNNVLRCQPNNVKAIFRKAKMLSARGDITEAIQELQKALTLEPDNSAVKSELQILKAKAIEASRQEKNLYRKMLGSSNSDRRSGTDSDRDGSNRSKLIPWGMVFGSVAVVLAGMVAYRYKLI